MILKSLTRELTPLFYASFGLLLSFFVKVYLGQTSQTSYLADIILLETLVQMSVGIFSFGITSSLFSISKKDYDKYFFSIFFFSIISSFFAFFMKISLWYVIPIFSLSAYFFEINRLEGDFFQHYLGLSWLFKFPYFFSTLFNPIIFLVLSYLIFIIYNFKKLNFSLNHFKLDFSKFNYLIRDLSTKGLKWVDIFMIPLLFNEDALVIYGICISLSLPVSFLYINLLKHNENKFNDKNWYFSRIKKISLILLLPCSLIIYFSQKLSYFLFKVNDPIIYSITFCIMVSNFFSASHSQADKLILNKDKNFVNYLITFFILNIFLNLYFGNVLGLIGFAISTLIISIFRFMVFMIKYLK